MIDSVTCGAWKELDCRLRPFVARRLSTPADIDDVLQEIFLRVQRGLPGLQQHERFGPWIYRVARSAIADQWRARARHPLADVALALDEPASDNDDDYPVEHELAGYVAPMIALLPSPYREALTLIELEGLSQQEAADMLGLSLSGMKSRVQRGRLKLRELFETCCEIALDTRGRVIDCHPKVEGSNPCERCG